MSATKGGKLAGIQYKYEIIQQFLSSFIKNHGQHTTHFAHVKSKANDPGLLPLYLEERESNTLSANSFDCLIVFFR